MEEVMVVLRKMRGNEEVEGRQGLRRIETGIDGGYIWISPRKMNGRWDKYREDI